MAQWYYLISDQENGPIDDSGIRELKDANPTHDFYVWREGMETWAKVSECEVFRVPPLITNPTKAQGAADASSTVLDASSTFVDRLLMPVPWRRVFIAVGAIVALLIVWNTTASVIDQVKQRRHAAEQQRLMVEAQKREAEEQRRQAEDPIMRARTKTCWSKINAAESGLIEYSRSTVGVVDYFNRRAFVFSQIDVDDVDPALVAWIKASIDNSKQWVAIYASIEQERQKLAEFNKGAETFLSVVGVVAGALAQNGQPVENNIQLGKLAGDLAGKGSSLFITSLNDADLQKRYGARENGCRQQLDGLWQQRGQVAEWLSAKYQTTFFNPF
jgi:hypothetical protein